MSWKYILVFLFVYCEATRIIDRTDTRDDNPPECYGVEDDVCEGSECPTTVCEWYEDSCVIQEITDKLSLEKTLTYGCAIKPNDYFYDFVKCCKDKNGNKDCRRYSQPSLSNGDQNLDWDKISGETLCSEDPPIPTTTTSTIVSISISTVSFSS